MGFLRRLVIIILGLLCLVFVHQVILLAPHPRLGKPIKKSHYDINLSRFSEIQSTLNDDDRDVKSAAAQLERTYIPSHIDESLENLLKEGMVVTFTSRVVANFKYLLYQALQYVGWSHSDASGFVQRAQLYVASIQQFQDMIPETFLSADFSQALQMVDVGSGAGTETAKLAEAIALFSNSNNHDSPLTKQSNPLRVNVTCLESAESLRRQLRTRGFTVANSLEDIADGSIHVGVLLNVLDRCDNPVDLVRAMLQKLQTFSGSSTEANDDSGYLIIGIVLPFKGGRVLEGKWGNIGKSASRRPRNRLVLPSLATTNVHKKMKKWIEFQAAHFLSGLLRHTPHLQVVRWTRLPYVSVGGVKWTHSTLDMVLLVVQEKKKVIEDNLIDRKEPNGEDAQDADSLDTSDHTVEMDKTEL